MLVLIALVYLLLCVRLCLQLTASFERGQGHVSCFVSVLGIQLRREYILVRGESAFSLRLEPLEEKKRRKAGSKNQRPFVNRLIKSILLDALRGGRFERISLRLGLGDACMTAIAAGAVRALLCAMIPGGLRGCDLYVKPEFSGICAHAAGIFSCQAGDIMLAALKTASGKRARD